MADTIPGDPEGLQGAISQWGTIAGATGTQRGNVRTGVTEVEATWKGDRKQAFSTAGDGIVTQLGGLVSATNVGVTVLAEYRRVLREGQDEVERLKQRRRTKQTELENADEDTPGDPQGAIDGINADIDAEVQKVRRAGGTAAAALDDALDLLLPGASRLTPAQIRSRVANEYGVHGIIAAINQNRLTAEQAWAALAAPQQASGDEAWRLWAMEYGLDVPADLDAAEAAALQAQLDEVIAATAGYSPEDRAAAIAEFADTLTEEELVTLAALDPERVGNLDGIPNAARYLANRFNVTAGIEAEMAKLAEFQAEFGPDGPTMDDVELVDYNRLLGRIETMQKLLDGRPLDGDTQAHGPYQVLAFEGPTYDGLELTDDGRLAVVVGDLDNAAHVGVVVPGITNRIDNFAATFDKAENTQALAPDSATIAWLGYDTPEFEDSVTEDDAVRGGAALAGFLQGIQRAEGSDLTIMAHSYGTLVTSKALQDIKLAGWDRPDRVVLFGSPGLGKGVDSVDDLGMPEGSVFALRAPGDGVSITASHGEDPVGMEGIIQLATEWGPGQPGVHGHSEYTKPRSGSLWNIAGVLAGWGLPDGTQNVGPHLTPGGAGLDEGLLGSYNENLRLLVDELLGEQVDPATLSEFIRYLEDDIQLQIETGEIKSGDLSKVPVLVSKLYAAAHASGLYSELSRDELGRAIRDAGFTKKAGADVDNLITGFFDKLDHLDGVDVPITLPGGLGRPPIVVNVPLGGLNEFFGDVAGNTGGFLTEHLSNFATRHLPSLEKVLGAVTVIATTYEGLRWTINTGKDVIHGAIEGGKTVLRETGEAVDRGLEAGEELLRDTIRLGRDGAEQVGELAKEAAERAEEGLEDLRDAAVEGVGDLRDAAEEGLDDLKDGAGDIIEGGGNLLESGGSAVKDKWESLWD